MEEYRHLSAYVLLGDPGAGKTTSFTREAEESGGTYIKARDFATFDPDASLKAKTLFIDGLDEMRAGAGDGRTPLDQIRRHLDRLGRPRFRLSCREADWLGASDREALLRTAPGGDLVVLQLNPLTDDDVLEVLGKKYSLPRPEDFVHQAETHGLSELLRNPQTLDLLVEAVSGDSRPHSREQTYELACKQLLRERNVEHRQAKRETSPLANTLLDAAGFLCSVHLLSGNAGFAMDEGAADEQHIDWRQLTAPTELPLLAALKSKLFRSDASEQQRIPVHRSVAEYLGARYLAARVETDGLPLGRVVALMAGDDGGIVADLRGLSAWLAVRCRSGRLELIERDPLGVVLYGDVRGFPVEDKTRVLAALEREARRYPWFRSEDWASAPFGALATPDMVPTFREILASPSRSEADIALLVCILDALQHGATYLELDSSLDAIVRDAGYPPHIRRRALTVQLRELPRNADRFLRLTKEVFSGTVEDRDDQILGLLLTELYPEYISPTEILDFLHPLKQRNLIAEYHAFWGYRLSDATPVPGLPVLLDQMVQRNRPLRKTVDEFQITRMAGGLLVRGLENHGDAATDERIYDWLGVGLDQYEHPRIDGDSHKRVSEWLAQRPDRYKALLREGALRCLGREDSSSCLLRSVARLYGAAPPADIGPWYLEQAKQESHQELAQHYFELAVWQLIRDGGQPCLTLVGLEFLETWTAANPSFLPFMEAFTTCRFDDWRREEATWDRQRNEELRQQKSDWVQYFRQHLDAIRDGTAHPKVLYDLAQAYLKRFYEVSGETPRERLIDFLGGDMELVDAAYQGFRFSLNRHDLPSVAEIVELEVQGRMHYIRQACLVGMEEFYASSPVEALRLNDTILSKLLAFHLTFATNKDRTWFQSLVKERPALVAEVLVAYAIPLLRKGKDYVNGLHSLAFDDAYAAVARVALPRLLSGFPVRARKGQLAQSLDPLLTAALRHTDRTELGTIISIKLKHRSLDDAQRVYWLACGLMIAPEAYESKLASHVGKSKVRRGYLASFMHRRERRHRFEPSLPESALALLIELLAPDSSSERPAGVYRVSRAMDIADEVRSLIDILAGNPSEKATLELERLFELPQLAGWSNQLRGAAHAQRIARRKAEFTHLDAGEVCRTLANLEPANAPDLAALALDHLRDIARKISDGSTNDYRQYWSYDPANRVLTKPKPENDCRDALLSDLSERLGRLGVDSIKEGYYAEDKRADIRVAFGGAGGFNVPIEIKKDSHDNLWRAIHEQLIKQYARDPGADGYGIYVVFWFGGKGMPLPLDGKKLDSASELENRLRRSLTPDEQHRISVCVIDCSLP